MAENEYPPAVDCRGERIRIGDIIVYPVRRKSEMVLKEATVCEVPGKGCLIKLGVVALNERGRRVIVEKTDRCAVVSDFIHRNNRRGDLADV